MGSHNAWDKQLNYLKEYFSKHQKWPKEATEFPEGNKLGQWCLEQRKAVKEKQLDERSILRLLDVHFSFLSDEEKWMLQYQWLLEYRDKHQDQLPEHGVQFPPGNFLGRWLDFQKLNLKEGNLDSNKVDLLKKIDSVL